MMNPSKTRHSRRRFIRVLGSTSVIGAAAPLVGACAPMPDEAIEAWRLAGREADLRRRLLSWAILAPNPHNRQPWLVDLRDQSRIVLHCDLDRLLPMTDPPGRQILIGHGCFIELLVQAAAESGFRAAVELFPEGEPGAESLDARPVASIALATDTLEPDPLFAQVLRRHTYKLPFADRKVPREALDALLAACARPGVRARAAHEPALVAQLNRVLVQAWEIEQRTPRTWKESVELTRVGAADIARHRDGISLGGTMMEVLRLLGQMSLEKAMDPDSQYFAAGLDRVRDWAPTTSAYAWLTTGAIGRVAQIEVGRAFVRLQLKATELGLVTQPPSQVLQEYPEMDALRVGFEKLVGQRDGEKTQMLVRIGYADAPNSPSPRRELGDFIRSRT